MNSIRSEHLIQSFTPQYHKTTIAQHPHKGVVRFQWCKDDNRRIHSASDASKDAKAASLALWHLLLTQSKAQSALTIQQGFFGQFVSILHWALRFLSADLQEANAGRLEVSLVAPTACESYCRRN